GASAASLEGRTVCLLRRLPSAGAEALLDVFRDHLLEVVGYLRAAQCCGLLAVDEDGGRRRLARARQGYADVGMLGLARAVDDASHHGDLEFLDARIFLAPDGHVAPEVVLNGSGKLLEHRRRRASATGACRHDRHELAEAHRL